MCKSSSILLSMMVLTGSMMFGNVGVQAAVKEPTKNPAVATEGQTQDTVSTNVDNEKYSVTFSENRKTVAVSNKDQLQVSIKSIDVYYEDAVNHYEVDNGMGASKLTAPGNDMTTGELHAITKVVVTYEYKPFSFPQGIASEYEGESGLLHAHEGLHRMNVGLGNLDLSFDNLGNIKSYNLPGARNAEETDWDSEAFTITVHKNEAHPELSTFDIAAKEGFVIRYVDADKCYEAEKDGNSVITGLPIATSANIYYEYKTIEKEKPVGPEGEEQAPEGQKPNTQWGILEGLPVTGADMAVFAAVSAGLAGLGFTVRKFTKGGKDDDEE